MNYEKLYKDLLTSLETNSISPTGGISTWSNSAPTYTPPEESDNWRTEPKWVELQNHYYKNITYLKNYDRMVTILTDKINPIAFTISPKNTPIMKNKNLDQQYNILQRLFQELRAKFNIQYISCYELYTCGENLHCHGFIRPSKPSHITKIKTYIRNFIHKNNPPRTFKKDPALDLPLSPDLESIHRCTLYIFKNQPESANQGFPISHCINTFQFLNY